MNNLFSSTNKLKSKFDRSFFSTLSTDFIVVFYLFKFLKRIYI